MMLKLSPAALALASILGCVPPATVSAKLQHALESGGSSDVVHLADLTDFDWEIFVVLGPYTTREGAEAALGFPWPDFERFDLESSDGFSLLVFANDDSVVRVEHHPRCKPDFAASLLQKPLARSDAVISIDRSTRCPLARAAD